MSVTHLLALLAMELYASSPQAEYAKQVVRLRSMYRKHKYIKDVLQWHSKESRIKAETIKSKQTYYHICQ